MLRPLIAAILLAVACSSLAVAQKSYTIEAPIRDTTLGIRGYIDFPVLVTNVSPNPTTIYVTRFKNELPSLEWISYICSRDLCFPPERNNADPVDIAPGANAHYNFSVSCGSTPGEVGRFGVEISDGASIDTLYFNVTVASGAGTDPVVLAAPELAWPSPSRDIVNIPVPQSQGVIVQVLNIAGAVVARLTTDGATSKALDVRTLPPGVYYYQVAGKSATSGSFVISR